MEILVRGGINMPIEEKKMTKPAHNFLLENRERMSISGVVDVDVFNPDMVIIQTEMGMLTVKGRDLHINKLSLETTELIVDGEIASCVYSTNEPKSSEGFLAKLFK